MKAEKWICDTCGGYILHAQDGWVEWLDKYENGKRTGRGLRLVHKFVASPRDGSHKCQYDGNAEYQKDGMTLSDTDLTEFQGPDGLMELLGMLSDNELPKGELLEMIKRIHIPGYEFARHHFNEAISDGVFESNTKPGFHSQSNIQATIAWLNQKENLR